MVVRVRSRIIVEILYLYFIGNFVISLSFCKQSIYMRPPRLGSEAYNAVSPSSS